MKVEQGRVYKDEEGLFFLVAMSGNFFLVDVWECDENGNVSDIEENPNPTPKNTEGLVETSVVNNDYSYPEFSHKFF